MLVCEVVNGCVFGFVHCYMNSETSDVFVFNSSPRALFSSVPMSLAACWCWLLSMSTIHPSSPLSCCSHSRLSDWSVVFVFNTSLNEHTPSAPILLTACWCWLLAMPEIHLSSSYCSPSRLSDWSVVFVFNASLSALAPSSPMSFPAC